MFPVNPSVTRLLMAVLFEIVLGYIIYEDRNKKVNKK